MFNQRLSLTDRPRLRRVDSDWLYSDHGGDDNETNEIIQEFAHINNARTSASKEREWAKSKALDELREKAYARLSSASKEHERERGGARFSTHSGHSHFSHMTGPTSLEWYTYHLHGLGMSFDLEMWWRHSKNFIRLHAFLLAVLLVIFVFHLLAGITFIVLHFLQSIQDPYLCNTPECKHASQYLSQTMNTEEDPCTNFYEFMCGKFDEEQTKNVKFDRLLIYPGFILELGEPSLLSKILKDFKHDPAHDQSIRYYQSCLNEPNKQVHGIKALLDKIEYIFGTRDFSTFNSATQPSMEEIASRIFQVVGHAVFLEISFSTYPFIQVMKPPRIFHYVLDDDFRFGNRMNRKYVEKVFNYLMPKLGLPPDSPEIQEMVNAIGYWGFLMNKIISIGLGNDFSRADGQATYQSRFEGKGLALMCPPMNIKFNYKVVFDNFVQDSNWQEQYYDHEAETFFDTMKKCFSKSNGFQYTHQEYNLTAKYSRLAFASFWLYGLFQEILPIMHSDFILSYTGKISEEEWKEIKIMEDFYSTERKIHIEYKCLVELWRSLGYMPSLRYLSANVKDPIDYMENNMKEIQELYKKTRKLYWRIPKNEIHPFMARQGELLLRRELQVDLIMPLVGKIFATFPDKLEFTDDHLNNYFVALNLTIQSGRTHWLASTDRRRSPKWWGFGSKTHQVYIHDVLISFEAPFTDPARYDKTKPGVFTEGNWQTFLGRKDYNYIRFPLSLYNEPHITETLSLKTSGSTYKVIRTFMNLLAHVADFRTYPYYMEFPVFPGGPISQEIDYLGGRTEMRPGKYNVINENLKCYTTTIERGIMNKSTQYKYPLELHKIQQVSNNDWPELNNFFLNTITLKFAYKIFNEKRKEILKLNYSSKLPKEIRDFRLHRFLPGKMEKYTEDQLFFMSYTRHLCMQRWNKPNIEKATQNARYEFEVDVLNILSQTEEFQKTFKCKGKSFMNNRGKPKCFHWLP